MLGGILVISLILGAAFCFAEQYGKEKAEREELEKQIEAGNERIQVDDGIAKLSPFAKRKLLSNWTMPGVETDKTDTH